MKKTQLIVPLLAMVLVLTGCSKKPVEPIDTLPAGNTGTQPTGNVMPEEDETLPETNETEGNEQEGTTPPPTGENNENSGTEGGGSIVIPDLNIKLPKLEVINPNDDEEDDSTLPVINPELNLKVKLPVIEEINPPIPNPGF